MSSRNHSVNLTLKNTTLVETTPLSHGVTLPHYYCNEELHLVGNCRMCLVEVEKVFKHVVSCVTNALSATRESVIHLNSVFVKKASENIMEFLLINRPLDCSVCDQGGNCDLQDQSLYFGFIKRRFYIYKRSVEDKRPWSYY